VERKGKVKDPRYMQNKKDSMFSLTYTTCSDLEIFMNNPSSCCGLVDARISASEKDLPV
jgi:hypothetical protein